MPASVADLVWGDLSAADFQQVVEAAYHETVNWRRNLFKVPSGKAGKAFVLELAHLFRSYASATALESVALKAAMVMPQLLLQKPSATSKAKDHCDYLDRRLSARKRDDIDGLLCKGRVNQRHLMQQRWKATCTDAEHLAASFSKLML